MKHKLTNKGPEKAVRDSWMTEIPDRIGSDLGLPVAKTKFGDGKQKIDRTGWQATPQDGVKRERPDDDEDDAPGQVFTEERDRATASSVETYSKRARPDSLLEMHQKKIKKEKKKKSKKEKKEAKKKHKHKDREKQKKEERKPFDRDRDLQVNAFDDAKKKALIKHSQQLTSRFSNSTVQGQFL